MPVFRIDHRRILTIREIGEILDLTTVDHLFDMAKFTKSKPTILLHTLGPMNDEQNAQSQGAIEEIDLVVRNVINHQVFLHKIVAVRRHRSKTELRAGNLTGLAAFDLLLTHLDTEPIKRDLSKNDLPRSAKWHLLELPSQHMQNLSISILRERL